MTSPGAKLLDLCKTASAELILVSPFIKEKALRRLLDQVQEHVKLTCVTRWRPEEVKAGVSDLSVWDIVSSRPLSTLLLMPTLHAKYYRSDDSCLIGSANLTLTALGWSRNPNLELLIQVDCDSDLAAWESELYGKSVIANESIREQIQKLVDQLDDTPLVGVDHSIHEDEEEFEGHELTSIGTEYWLPTLRYPDLLFSAYSGSLDTLTTGARQTAISDLTHLKLGNGLRERAFKAVVGALLLQMPQVHSVDQFLSEPRRFGEVRALLRTLQKENGSYNSSDGWQTLMRWLRYFLPERYNVSVVDYSEIMFRL